MNFLSKYKINRKVVLRYSLFQIPGIMLVATILHILFKFDVISFKLAIFFMLLWVVKDIVLFPFVKDSYDSVTGGYSNTMVGRRGVAKEDFNHGGYVKISQELWMAEVLDESSSVKKGDVVEVVDREGLILKVKHIGK